MLRTIDRCGQSQLRGDGIWAELVEQGCGISIIDILVRVGLLKISTRYETRCVEDWFGLMCFHSK